MNTSGGKKEKVGFTFALNDLTNCARHGFLAQKTTVKLVILKALNRSTLMIVMSKRVGEEGNIYSIVQSSRLTNRSKEY